MKIIIDKVQEVEEISIETYEDDENTRFEIVENNITVNRLMKKFTQENKNYKRSSSSIDIEFSDLKKELDMFVHFL